MQESFLLRIALMVSVVGIIALYLISAHIEINDTTIDKITSVNSPGVVSLTGVVTSIQKHGSATIITIAQTNNIDIVVFDKNASLKKGDTIKVTGKSEKYNGNIEIIATTIEEK